MSIYFGIILCTRIPLCHKFHELVDCIRTKLKIVTSMQFKLCTASWLEWGGTQYKSVYRGVPQTWVAKSRWSDLSGPFSLQNLVPKITESVPKEHKFSQKLWYLYYLSQNLGDWYMDGSPPYGWYQNSMQYIPVQTKLE